jgi:xanthine dehydrogenase iron-sulfur cluster and FAD-binding subunit A
MRYFFIFFPLLFLQNILLFSSNLERSFVSLTATDETTYPYRDNCCAVCVQRVLDDEDEFHPSRLRDCLRTGCALCTGCFVLSMTLVWVVKNQH